MERKRLSWANSRRFVVAQQRSREMLRESIVIARRTYNRYLLAIGEGEPPRKKKNCEPKSRLRNSST